MEIEEIKRDQIEDRLCLLADPRRVKVLQRFFKTGPGEYGEGDVFVGLRVPEIRKLAREYKELPFSEAICLLQSTIHEARLLALLVLIHHYSHGDSSVREQIYSAYLHNTRFINSWDLVDVSAEHIVGSHLRNGSRDFLFLLARSDLLWDRRISIMATFHFIKHGEFVPTLELSKILLKDREDLIQKAVGWMLREIGKRDRATEEVFLREHYKVMPRTMLRYAIEKFPEELRKQYLKGEV